LAKKELSKRDVLIAQRVLEGKTQREIGQEFDISQPSVSLIKNRPDMKEIINRGHERLIRSSLTYAVDNMDYLVQGYKKTKDKQEKDHGYKATEKVLESAGLLSSHAQSYVHQTYINQQTNVTNPIIDELISKHLGKMALEKPVWELEDAEVSP
jgi:hypothetical protein